MRKQEQEQKTLKDLGIPEFLDSYLSIRKHVYTLNAPKDALGFNGMLARIKENFVAAYPHASLDKKEPIVECTRPVKREEARLAKIPAYLWAYVEVTAKSFKLSVPNNEMALMRLCKLIFENHVVGP